MSFDLVPDEPQLGTDRPTDAELRPYQGSLAGASDQRPWLASRRLPKTSNASGMVLMAPPRKSVHPTARRWLSESRSDSNRPRPAPRATRVPAIRPSSGTEI